ncbi:MAG TPA: hypothetical protein VJH92_05830 [Candidatus Nanoarchaeia archaeon]|nr:hypothetical protein [Candidatus Nanoarchaeia archaeon]
MAREEPLYQDEDMKITLLSDVDGNIKSGEDHELWLIKSGNRYIIQRGILKQLARTSRDDLGTLLERINPGIGISLRDAGLTYDSVGVAISQVYIEEQERFEIWQRQQKTAEANL